MNRFPVVFAPLPRLILNKSPEAVAAADGSQLSSDRLPDVRAVEVE